MKHFYYFIWFHLLGMACAAQGIHPVISQVYGAGGNSGATYNRDFVELFNPGSLSFSLAGYSIQYASAAGTTWASRALSGSIAPNSYFLVQMTLSGSNGAALPAPDYTVSTSTDMGGTSGKLALVNGTTALSGACPSGLQIIDLVGYGATASCFEGTGPAPAPGTTTAAARAGNGCIDTDQNQVDFATMAVSPRNSLTPVNSCGALPVHFSTFRATVKAEKILLEWTNDTEENLAVYEIEKSTDGTRFEKMTSVLPLKNDGRVASYAVMDHNPGKLNNFYRVKAIETSGNMEQTPVLRIRMIQEEQGLMVYPNPVREGLATLSMSSLPAGQYQLVFLNTAGQQLMTTRWQHRGGPRTETLKTGHLQAGMYRIRVRGPVQKETSLLILR